MRTPLNQTSDIDSLRKAVESHPDWPISNMYLAEALEQAGKLQEALQIRERVESALLPGHTENQAAIERLRSKLADHSRQMPPDDKFDFLAKASYESEQAGDLDLAIVYQKEIVQMQSDGDIDSICNNPNPANILAGLYYKNGQMDEAFTLLAELAFDDLLEGDCVGMWRRLNKQMSPEQSTQAVDDKQNKVSNNHDVNLDLNCLEQYEIPLLIRFGVQAKKEGKLGLARDILREAVNKIDQRDGTILDDPNPAMALADVYYQLQQYDKAQAIWNEFESNPVRGVKGLSIRTCIRHSRAAQEEGRWADVVVFQERILQLNANNIKAMAILAKAYCNVDQFQQACALYEALAKRDELTQTDRYFWRMAKESLEWH